MANNNDQNKSANMGKHQTGPIIPMNRVKTIMKSSPEITNINPDTLFLVCKATVRIRNLI